MSLQRIVVPALALTVLILGYRYYGWMGLATAGGLLVMWVLLHFTRLMHVLRRAAQRPVGYLDSAVMLNAKLKPGMTLMHVIAMTRSLGQLQTERDAQPEVFRWTDPSQSWVECTFEAGRLRSHIMHRPPPELDNAEATAAQKPDAASV
ncbi:MAG: glycerate kinase [Betaproteobacteria bacterium]|nr:glycerate kinase [Betaproteobacteria bacterium]